MKKILLLLAAALASCTPLRAQTATASPVMRVNATNTVIGPLSLSANSLTISGLSSLSSGLVPFISSTSGQIIGYGNGGGGSGTVTSFGLGTLVGIGGGALVGKNDENARVLAWTAILLVIASGLIGAYQTGMEYHLLPGPASCSGHRYILGSNMPPPEVQCDAVTWSLFGLSMASYNALCSFLIAALGTFGLMKARHAA